MTTGAGTAAVILAASAVALLACPGSEERRPGTEIGPGGGVVEDASGAKVAIPPGALAAPVRIVLRVHAGADELPAPFGVYTGWAGSVELEPSGLAFALPVEVELPLAGAVAPSAGGALPVFLHGTAGWRRHLPDALVVGPVARFQTDHFSAFALAADHARAGGWLAPLVEAYFANPPGLEGHADAYLAWLRDVAGLGLGARWPASVPGQGYECQEVVGLQLVADAAWPGGETTVVRDLGRETPVVLVWDGAEDRSGAEGDTLLRVTLSIYFECASPSLSLAATPGVVRPDQPAALAASLSCGAHPMVERALDFTVASGPGSVAPAGVLTGEDGAARSVFSAATQGEVSIEAIDLACRAFSPRTVVASAHVTVADAPQRWTANLTTRAVVEENYDYQLVWDARASGPIPFRSGDPACAAEVASVVGLSGEWDVCGGGVLAASSVLQGYSDEEESCDAVQLSVGSADVYVFGRTIPGGALVAFVLTSDQVCSYVLRYCTHDYCLDPSGTQACANQGGTCRTTSCCWDRGPDDQRNERHCGVDDAIHGVWDPAGITPLFLELTLADGATAGTAMAPDHGYLPGSAWSLRIDRAE